jgi:ABC-type branched-subunit amino acid transport system substrate-binding protein
MRARWVAVLAVLTLAAAACGNSSSGKSKNTTTTSGSSATTGTGAGTKFPPVNQPGVTPTEIRVSGVASTTNPLGGLYGTAFDGVQAYFDMINSEGGIYGRKLTIVKRHDDQLSNNQREVEAIIDQDNAFAVLPVATIFSFSGAGLLAKAGIPTFGWGINDEWTGPPNFFGHVGALCNGADCPSPTLPWLAQKLGKKKVAVLAYNVANSADCADGVKASFDKYNTGPKLVFNDKSLSFGVTDLSSDVKKMVDAKVDFVTTCMDTNGVLTLAREMRQQGLNAIQYLPNGYDQDFMSKNGGFFEGSYVFVQEAPIETRPQFQAMKNYVKWMGKAGSKLTENAEIGWINADQFVTGLRMAGPDFTRQKVIDSLNTLTAYNAGGMICPINWTKQHTDRHYPINCGAFVKVHDSKFVPQTGSAGKPFTNLVPPDPTSLSQVKAQYLQ